MNSEPIVFIVDDDPSVRQSQTMLVESMHLTARAYDSAQGFLTDYNMAQQGCLLLDVRLPGISGLDLLEQLARDNILLPVIVISAFGDVPMVVRAMRAGALNFLEKPCRDQELWEAIQEAFRWNKDNRERLVEAGQVRGRIEHLSSGEHDVLQMLVAGKSNKTIAASLNLSVRTIEVRRAKVMQKMQATSLAELVRLALASDEFNVLPQEEVESP